MKRALVLQHDDLSRCDLSVLQTLRLPEARVSAGSLRCAVGEGFALDAAAAEALTRQEIDFAVVPDLDFAGLGLLVSDMDSTLITIECIDEIAAAAGLKAQVAEITERAMQGEIDFEQSLRRRTALLEGLNEAVLEQVYGEVLRLSPGAEFLLDECRRHGVAFMLVSGGFTFFTGRLQQRFGFDSHHANELEIREGRLTGRLNGGIIDAAAKARLLRARRDALGLAPEQTAAVGDGANDIPMLEAAGTGIAYRAKPKTEAHADACIRFGGLERVRGWFG